MAFVCPVRLGPSPRALLRPRRPGGASAVELAVRRGSLDCTRLSLTPPTLPCTRDAQEGFGPECVIFRADGPPVATWPPVLPACATASWRWRGPSGGIARRFQASSWETGNSPPWRFVTSSFGRASGAGWGPRKGQRAPGLPPLPLGSHVPRALEPGEGGGGRGRGSAGPRVPSGRWLRLLCKTRRS